ncbi:MAG: hypothetical protein IT363_11915 [Methanoregulaceae archaeon]|nr:hypothetical protein [Methanoregulaceae archaeon]
MMAPLIAEGRDDLVRSAILRHLYNSRKRRTKGFKTTEIEKELKRSGIRAGEVRSNLPYLLDNEWVVREESERQFRAKGGTMQSATATRYRISAKGVDLVNGQGSPYTQNQGKYAGIHIENVQGTVILGDNNTVSERAVEVIRPLDALAQALEASVEVENQVKYDMLAELGTLRAALTKPEPNRTVVRATVDALAPLANVATIAAFLHQLQTALNGGGLL